MDGKRTGLAATALLCLFAAAAPATAQDADGFNMQNFEVPTDPHGYITMNGARTLRQWIPFVAVGINWAHNPLTFVEPGEDLVQDLTQLDLAVGLGVFEFGDAGGLEIGLHVPIILDLHGRRFDDLDRRLPSGGFGDIQANVKATLFDREEDLIGIFGRFYADFPSGEEEDFLSNKDKITLGWQLGVEKQISRFRIGVEIGYEWLDSDVQLGGIQVDDKLRLNAGLGFELLDDLWAVLEVNSWGRIGHLYERARESPVELGGAIKYTGGLYAMIGGSAGLNRGVGAPDGRVFFAVGFAP